ncbi:MAG: LysE family translocator [Alphaproteobacteria bacterium]|nr:LysE family translocator [Alphaproteobacteria bacterium]
MLSPEFLLTAFIVVVAPGTGVVYTLATGLGRGRVASLAAATGCTGATVLHLGAALIGLAALLHTSALLFLIVKYAGVAYLIWLAIQTLRDKGPVRFEPDRSARTLWQTAWTGFVINVLNPKISIFFVAFLPQFMSGDPARSLAEILVLGGTFVVLTFLVFVVYGQLASFVRDRVLASQRAMAWFRRVTAAAFAMMGARLALPDA